MDFHVFGSEICRCYYSEEENKMFTICIPTYNRHELLKSTLEAVLSQTYQDYEVFVVDRGSFPDVSKIVEEFNNEKFHYIKSSQEERLFQSFTNIVKNKMKGDCFLFLGDDDTLLPNSLEIVAKTFDKNPQLEILQTGLVHYNLKNNTTTDSLEMVAKQYLGDLIPFDGEKLCLWYLSSWGIGKKFKMAHPKASHSSGFFIKKSLIDKIFDKDKNIFVEPFVDIGYVGCCYEAKTLYCLDLPLVIIGEGHIRETDGAKKNSRQKWDNEIQFFENSPLTASSWQNCGIEGHLQVAHMHNLEKKYNLKLRPDFFRKHLLQVLSDEPKTKQTVNDFLSAIPFYLKSYVDYPNYIVKDMLRLCSVFKLFKRARKTKEKSKKESVMKFENVKEYAVYLNEFLVKENEKVLVFCNDYPQYPTQEMCDEFLLHGIKMISGGRALELIAQKDISPEDMFIVQELLANDAKKLLQLGAKPSLLTSGETTIWAPLLYDNLEKEAQLFRHKLLFKGSFNNLGGLNEFNHHFYFPSYSQKKALPEIKPLGDRNEIVMVVANKYCCIKFPTSSDFNKFWTKLKTCFSKSFHMALKDNLQIKRLEIIEYFGKLNKLELYGANWNKKKDIPSKSWNKLKSILPNIYKGRCEDKIDVISNYKFAIAFENISYTGYITEKIIDCFVAGVVPIYLGAPDICDFVPKNCFIDVRDFKNHQELNAYLASLCDDKIIEFINNGRQFLQSEEGKKYSEEYFVQYVADLFKKEVCR